jgi:hypothetical protein
LPSDHRLHYAASARDRGAVACGAGVTRETTSTNAGMTPIPGSTGPHTPRSL